MELTKLEKIQASRRVLIIDELREGMLEPIVKIVQRYYPKSEIFTSYDALEEGIPEHFVRSVGAAYIEAYPGKSLSKVVKLKMNIEVKRVYKQAFREGRQIIAQTLTSNMDDMLSGYVAKTRELNDVIGADTVFKRQVLVYGTEADIIKEAYDRLCARFPDGTFFLSTPYKSKVEDDNSPLSVLEITMPLKEKENYPVEESIFLYEYDKEFEIPLINVANLLADSSLQTKILNNLIDFSIPVNVFFMRERESVLNSLAQEPQSYSHIRGLVAQALSNV